MRTALATVASLARWLIARLAGSSARRRPWRLILAWLIIAITSISAVTARVFVWPVTGMPHHVNAIVVPAGPGDRLRLAVRLAHERRARYLVISRGFHGYGGPCPSTIRGIILICFEPDPASTRGEAEFTARLARQHHWHSIALVTSVVQDSRARWRMEHCFRGAVYVETVGLPLHAWPYELAYEWAATLKMIVLQPGC